MSNGYNNISALPIRMQSIAQEPEHYAVGQSYTGPQVASISLTGTLDHQSPVSSNPYIEPPIDFNKARAMRRDPTISLARLIAVAPVLMVDWDYVTCKDDYDQTWADFIKEYVDPLRKKFMRSLLFGEFDYGWKAFEKIFTVHASHDFGQRVIIKKLKPLKNDNTWVVLDTEGEFDGLLHRMSYPYMGHMVRINRTHSVFVNFNDDDTGDYAEPIIQRAESVYDEWQNANSVVKRFDEKVAGALWHIQYPEGKEPHYLGRTNVDRAEIADDIIKSIKSTGYLKTPSQLKFNGVDEQLRNMGLSSTGWSLELIESKGTGGDLIPRLEYLDKLKIRACGVLERAISEGHYGTKAEAEAHLNVMLLAKQLKLSDIADALNEYIIDHLTYLNYGVVNVVKAVPQAIVGNPKEHLTNVLSQLMGTEAGPDIAERIDVSMLLEIIDVPQRNEDEIEEEQARRAGGMMDVMRNVISGNSGAQQATITPEQLTYDQPSPTEQHTEQLPTDSPLDVAAVEVRLNGAQITAALEVMASVSNGITDANAGVLLLESLGIDTEQAKLIIGRANATQPLK